MGFDVKTMIDVVRTRMSEQGIDWSEEQMQGLTDALSHPEAAATIEQSFAREAGSVEQGQQAPDFALKLLHDPKLAPVQLSSHWGRRPVALIFGSYT